MGFIPAGFLVADYEGRDYDIPEYFDSMDLESYASIWTYQMNETEPSMHVVKETVDIGGHDCALIYMDNNTTPTSDIFLRFDHYYAFFIIPQVHGMKFHWNDRYIGQKELYAEEHMDVHYATTDKDGTLKYRVQCDHFRCDMIFGFNNTLYSKPSEAWVGANLWVLVGIELDQISTSYNAWSLISALLFFQIPEIHFIINMIIVIPIWGALSYIIVILILRIIGAIFGGGA